MNDTEFRAAVVALVAQSNASGMVTVGMESETAPIQFPAMPTTPPPESYYDGTPTRDAREAVDRARWGLWVDGIRHQTNATVIKLRADLDAWQNESLKNAAAEFSDPDLFFIFYMNGRISISGDFGTSMSAMRPYIVNMTVAEWLDSLPPAGFGGGHPSQPG